MKYNIRYNGEITFVLSFKDDIGGSLSSEQLEDEIKNKIINRIYKCLCNEFIHEEEIKGIAIMKKDNISIWKDEQ